LRPRLATSPIAPGRETAVTAEEPRRRPTPGKGCPRLPGSAGQSSAIVPDVLTIEVPLGGRVLAAGELLLGRSSTPSSEVATAELAAVIDAWEGPGAIVLAGGVFDLVGDARNSPATALAAHAGLGAALSSFTAQEGRKVVC